MKFIKANLIYIICILIAIFLFLLLFFSENEEFDYSNLTIVGDSRMVGLCSYSWYKSDKGTCIAKVSMGYSWLVKSAIPEVNKLAKNKKSTIAINLGVNDLYNINNYIKKYQELAQNDWKDSKIILVSINPTKGSYSKLNSEIDYFNDKLKESFKNYSNIIYCNTNEYLKENGFESSDGLHYNNQTSKTIYEQIKKCMD